MSSAAAMTGTLRLNRLISVSVIKNGFSIAGSEDGEIQVSVDNVFPLLKTLGLNPQNESVMDMVRDACMECKFTVITNLFGQHNTCHAG